MKNKMIATKIKCSECEERRPKSEFRFNFPTLCKSCRHATMFNDKDFLRLP